MKTLNRSDEVRKSLTDLIIKKLDTIKSKTINTPDDVAILTLTMVSEELDDVLLNWEMGEQVGAIAFGGLDDDLDDEEED